MNVVVAINGSPVSQHALSAALELFKQWRETPSLHLVAVVDYVTMPAGLSKAPADAPDLLEEEAETALSVAREMTAARGMECVLKTLRGPVGHSLLQYADEVEAGLIVTGTHGRKGIERALLGSTCEYILRHSHVPVLAVRGRA